MLFPPLSSANNLNAACYMLAAPQTSAYRRATRSMLTAPQTSAYRRATRDGARAWLNNYRLSSIPRFRVRRDSVPRGGPGGEATWAGRGAQRPQTVIRWKEEATWAGPGVLSARKPQSPLERDRRRGAGAIALLPYQTPKERGGSGQMRVAGRPYTMAP